MAEDEEPNPEDHKVFSRLIDLMDQKNERINWNRWCWREGRIYQLQELEGHSDNEYGTSHYLTSIDDNEIRLGFDIDWEEKTSMFTLAFTRWTKTRLNPRLRDLVLFSDNHFSNENHLAPDLPIFQIRYDTITLPFQEAKTAKQDFAEKGEDLTRYFSGMRHESLDQYHALVRKFRQSQEIEGLVRIGS